MGKAKDKTVFTEVQAALLNSDCDPNEAGIQGLCALYAFASTDLEGSSLTSALGDVLVKMMVQAWLPVECRKELRRVLRARKLVGK